MSAGSSPALAVYYGNVAQSGRAGDNSVLAGSGSNPDVPTKKFFFVILCDDQCAVIKIHGTFYFIKWCKNTRDFSHEMNCTKFLVSI